MLTASTTTPDDFTGTAAADTFTASLGRLQSDDALNGAGGNDVLNARLGATVTPVIANIETLNIEATAAASLDGANITGATNVNVTGGNTLTYLKQDGEAFSVAGAGTGLTVSTSVTDSATNAITVTLGAGKLGSVTVGDKQTTDYEIVNLVVAGVGSATLVEADSGANTESFANTEDKIVVTGAGDYTIAITSALLGDNATAGSEANGVIDATGHTGKLTLDLGTLIADNVSAKSWTGVDVIALGLETATDVLSNVASGTEVVVKGSSAGADLLTVTPNGTATTDTLTITLNNPTAGSSVDIAGIVADGFETLTVNSTGTDSSSATVLNKVADIAGTTTDARLTITGDKKLTATGIESTYTNITVSNTAGVDLAVDTGGALQFTGSTGSETLRLSTIADITSADKLVGGDGVDTLAITSATEMENADFTAAQIAAVTGFEVLEFTGAQQLVTTNNGTARSFDLTKFDSINTLRIKGALTTDADDTLTILAKDGFKAAFGAAVSMTTNLVDFQIAGASAAGSNNTVTVSLEGEAAGATTAVAGWKIGGVENQVIEVKGVFQTSDVITVSDIDGTVLKNLTIKSTAGNNTDGTAKVAESLTITTIESTLLDTVNASAYTGALTITGLASKYIATGATITGGSGADAITGGSGADVIVGGAGVDTLKGGTGDDNISGGTGNDNIYGDVGADILTGGAGSDSFFFATADSNNTSTNMDKISDFAALAVDQLYDILKPTANVAATTADRTASTLQSAATGTDLTGATSETDSGTVLGAITAAGKITFSGTSVANIDTLAEAVAAARIMLVSATTIASDSIASSIGFFEFTGNTYVVEETTTDVSGTETVTQTVVELTGLVGLTGMATTAAAGFITIA